MNNLRTIHPEDVAAEMKKLMAWYQGVEEKTIETVAVFHARYELIHLFQDGNGRTGRIIMFRECLANGICPFIVQDKNRAVYVTALKRAQTENDYAELVEYFQAEQSEYLGDCQYFSVEERYAECTGNKG